MSDKAVVRFINKQNGMETELEIPLFISANDLIVALNTAYSLGMDTENLFGCHLQPARPRFSNPYQGNHTVIGNKFHFIVRLHPQHIQNMMRHRPGQNHLLFVISLYEKSVHEHIITQEAQKNINCKS